MYRISRIYWAEAGKIVLPGDDPDRQGGNILINNFFIFIIRKHTLNIKSVSNNSSDYFLAFEDCALNEECAEQTIIHYLTKFGKVNFDLYKS